MFSRLLVLFVAALTVSADNVDPLERCVATKVSKAVGCRDRGNLSWMNTHDANAHTIQCDWKKGGISIHGAGCGGNTFCASKNEAQCENRAKRARDSLKQYKFECLDVDQRCLAEKVSKMGGCSSRGNLGRVDHVKGKRSARCFQNKNQEWGVKLSGLGMGGNTMCLTESKVDCNQKVKDIHDNWNEMVKDCLS